MLECVVLTAGDGLTSDATCRLAPTEEEMGKADNVVAP